VARVVVVGAGIAGLAVAARLARLQHRVTVCERGSGPGGAAGRLERDGFAFDTGPTLLHLPAGYRDLFVKTGRNAPLERVLELRPASPAVRWQFADGTAVELPNASRAGVTEALAAAFGSAAAREWDSFVATGDAVWAQFRKRFSGAPDPAAAPWRRALNERAARAALQPARSYRDLTRRHLTDARLRQAADSYVARLGSDPALAPAGAVLWPWLEQKFGSWEVVGGIRALVDAIAARAALRGCEFRYGAEVVAIEPAAGVNHTVRLRDGESLPADVVVAAVDDLTLARLCPPAAPSIGVRSTSAVCLLLALRGAGVGPFATVSFPEEASAERDELRSGIPSTDPTLFLSRGSAPRNSTACAVLAPAPRHGVEGAPGTVDWDAPGLAERYADALVRILDARGHAVSERLLWRNIHTPADLERRTGAPGGAVAGAALHGSDGLDRAPNATAVPGLFHVGGAAHPGPGLALAPLSAALVAEAIGRGRAA